MICTLPLYLCGYTNVLLEYEPARCVSGNNDYKVKRLAGMSNSSLFQAYMCLFICLLRTVFLEGSGN